MANSSVLLFEASALQSAENISNEIELIGGKVRNGEFPVIILSTLGDISEKICKLLSLAVFVDEIVRNPIWRSIVDNHERMIEELELDPSILEDRIFLAESILNSVSAKKIVGMLDHYSLVSIFEDIAGTVFFNLLMRNNIPVKWHYSSNQAFLKSFINAGNSVEPSLMFIRASIQEEVRTNQSVAMITCLPSQSWKQAAAAFIQRQFSISNCRVYRHLTDQPTEHNLEDMMPDLRMYVVGGSEDPSKQTVYPIPRKEGAFGEVRNNRLSYVTCRISALPCS